MTLHLVQSQASPPETLDACSFTPDEFAVIVRIITAGYQIVRGHYDHECADPARCNTDHLHITSLYR